jgi:hypothetical protein
VKIYESAGLIDGAWDALAYKIPRFFLESHDKNLVSWPPFQLSKQKGKIALPPSFKDLFFLFKTFF